MVGALLSLFKDLFVVTLGVFVALLVDRWRERRRERAFLRKAVDTILREAEEAREALPGLITKHTEIAEALSESARKGEDVPIGKIVASGIPLNVMQGSIALRLISGERAHTVKYELLKVLWDIDTLSLYVDHLSDKVSNFLMMKWGSGSPDDKYTLSSLLYTLVESERKLLSLYERLPSVSN